MQCRGPWKESCLNCPWMRMNPSGVFLKYWCPPEKWWKSVPFEFGLISGIPTQFVLKNYGYKFGTLHDASMLYMNSLQSEHADAQSWLLNWAVSHCLFLWRVLFLALFLFLWRFLKGTIRNFGVRLDIREICWVCFVSRSFNCELLWVSLWVSLWVPLRV